jgi:hypothetical protein
MTCPSENRVVGGWTFVASKRGNVLLLGTVSGLWQ